MITPNRKILVVDDDQQVLNTYHEVLVEQQNSSADELMDLLVDGFSLDEKESEDAVGLGNDSFELVSAASGEEALEIFKQADQQWEPFSVVFLDVRLPPGMDGIQCGGKIRDIDPHTYIVIASAHSDYSLDDMHNFLGYDFIYLRKPFLPDELLQLTRVFSYYWSRDHLERQKRIRLEEELSHCKQALLNNGEA